jgi:hypothetical protein
MSDDLKRIADALERIAGVIAPKAYPMADYLFGVPLSEVPDAIRRAYVTGDLDAVYEWAAHRESGL